MMPQFEPSTFASQIFWLLVCFALLWGAMHVLVVPVFRRILHKRGEILASLGERTERFQREADDLREKDSAAFQLVQREASRLVEEARRMNQERCKEHFTALERQFADRVREINTYLGLEKDKIVKSSQALVSELSDTVLTTQMPAATALVAKAEPKRTGKGGNIKGTVSKKNGEKVSAEKVVKKRRTRKKDETSWEEPS